MYHDMISQTDMQNIISTNAPKASLTITPWPSLMLLPTPWFTVTHVAGLSLLVL